MKKYLVIAVVALTLVSFSARTREPRPPLPTQRPNLNPMLCAHRGVKALAPENTIPAIEKAIEMGYSYVELDVRFSRDGAPVLLHDPSLLRMYGRPGSPSLYSVDALRDFRILPWKGHGLKNVRLPTLEEALQVMQGRIKLYLDQKVLPRPAELELLKKYGFYPDNMIVVGSGPQPSLFRDWDPWAPALPGASRPDDLPRLMAKFPGMVGINTDCATLTAEMVDAAHAAGLMVFTNVINLYANDEACMRKPIELGSDLIQIDNPELFKKVIEEYRNKQQERLQSLRARMCKRLQSRAGKIKRPPGVRPGGR